MARKGAVTVWILVSAALASIPSLSACGTGELAPPVAELGAASPGGPRPTTEALQAGVTLASVRGQNLVSVELHQRHDETAALEHVYKAQQFASELQATDAGEASDAFAQLQESLGAAADALQRPEVPALVSQPLAAAGRATLEIESALVGDASNSSAYRATLVARLVAASAEAYEKAVAPDSVEAEAYEDAYALLREAGLMHEGLASVLEEQTRDEVKEADTLLEAMFEAMPNADPPEDPVSPKDVSAAAYLLALVLEEHEGAEPGGGLDLRAGDLLAFSPPLLEEVSSTYAAGEAGVSHALARDLYEHLYAPLLDFSPAAAALGPTLQGLADAVRAGAPVSEVEDLSERAAEIARALAEELG
jgi:hypothetical protein